MPFLTFLILSFILLVERITFIREISFMEITLFYFKTSLLLILPVNFSFIIAEVFRKRKKKQYFKRILKEFELKRRKKEKELKIQKVFRA
jgi:hypothetical protein